MSDKKLIPNHSMIDYRRGEYADAVTRLLTNLEYDNNRKNLPPYLLEIVDDALAKREAWMNEPLYREG
jgi:hypothetical protein